MATNYLKSIGKRDVVKAFREYCRFASNVPRFDNGYFKERILEAIPLLFNPAQSSGDDTTRVDHWFSSWYSSIRIKDDIPFRPFSEISIMGPGLPQCENLIDHVHESCQFNSTPLIPSNSPNESVKRLIAEQNKEKKYSAQVKDHLLKQAARMLDHIDEPDKGVSWDAEKQEYVSAQ